jgi:hypothetical protein
MRGITTFIVMTALLSVALVVAVPAIDGLTPIAIQMSGDQYDPIIKNIQRSVLEYSVVVFLFTTLAWAVFWILRQERQEVRL